MIQGLITTTRRTALALLAAAALTSPSDARELRAGHILNAQSDQGQAIEIFARLVKERTKGELDTKVFHSGELGKSIPVQLESVLSGAQDFFIDTFDYFAAWDKRFGAINTPWVFRDRGHFRAFLQSDMFDDMVGALEKRGVVFLGKGKRNYNWIRAGDRGLLTRTPIMKPDDLKGFKLRMFQAEMPIKSWGAFGANIQVIPWPDVYTGLTTGAVDGLTGVLSTSYLTKHTEQVKFFTNVREYFQIVAPLVSQRSWNRMTAEQKAIVEQAALEAGEEYQKISIAERDRFDAEAQNSHGVTIIVPPIGPWIEKMKPVHAEFEKAGVLPAGLIAQIQAIK